LSVKSLFAGLERARRGFWGRLADVVSGRRPVDDQLWDTLEETLLESDMGVDLALALLSDLRRDLPRRADHAQLFAMLAERLEDLLGPAEPLQPPGTPGAPLVLAVVGVNGTGKTTSIGKLAHRYTSQGQKVVLGAADTFRAAAIEQLEIWSRRTGAAFVAHQAGADPAAVVFDAISAATARGAHVVILDTAGRLHTKRNLMDELRKVVRVAAKATPGAPHETLLVIDATTGGNALEQAKQFREASPLTGVILSKIDGTARGGTVFRIRRELGLPTKLVGTGEGLDDLVDFDPRAFVEALLKPVTTEGGANR
jgi:fused signal recognition particle receptor